MKGLVIKKKVEYTSNGIAQSGGTQSLLLHEEKNFEGLIEVMPKGKISYMYTIHENVFEFSYILNGQMELNDGKEIILLKEGDIYTHHTLEDYIMFRMVEDTQVLNINTAPYYEDYQEDEDLLSGVLDQLQIVDGETKDHCIRVRQLCMGIAYYLNFVTSQLHELYFAAIFHDVGKIKIPTEILLKPGKLTDEEYEIMKQHSRYTYEMIREQYGEDIATVAYEHHEKLDGTGYPRKLKADQIGLPARIICVADAYDAMTVTRPYHQGLTKEQALKELHRCENTQFDGSVIKALEAYLYDLNT